MKAITALLSICLCLVGATRAIHAADTKYGTVDEAIAHGDLADVQAHLKANPESVERGKHPTMTPLQQAILRKQGVIAIELIKKSNQDTHRTSTILYKIPRAAKLLSRRATSINPSVITSV